MWNPAIWPVSEPDEVRERFDSNPDDPNYRSIENFAYGDTPSREGVSAMVENLFVDPREEIFDLSLSEFSLHCDIRPLVLRTLLTYLELDGFLEGGTPFYANYRFKPLKTSNEILAAYGRTFEVSLISVAVMLSQKL